MGESVLPLDTFVVINKTMLNENDNKILINLYQPIIGHLAISLYMTFKSYLDKAEIMSLEYNHNALIADIRTELEDIIEARHKLEAIGLIKTLVKQDKSNNYVYQLFSPLSPYEFLNNPVLSTSLLSNIGKNKYQKIVEYFKVPSFNLNDYKDISISFSDLFDIKPLSNYENLINDLRRKNSNNINIQNQIDLNQILVLIPGEMLNKQSISNQTRDLIYKLSYIYNLNNEQMVELIKSSVDETKKIHNELLKENCRNYYSFDNSHKLPSLILKTQPEFLREKSQNYDKKTQMIYAFETVSPHDYLVNKNKGNKLTKGELNLLNYLMIDLNLNPGVVNVLIDYVLRINNNKLTKPYIEAIATQWVKENIKTVSSAMALAEKEYKKRKKISKPKTTIKPDWLNKEIPVNSNQDDNKKLKNMLKMFK